MPRAIGKDSNFNPRTYRAAGVFLDEDGMWKCLRCEMPMHRDLRMAIDEYARFHNSCGASE